MRGVTSVIVQTHQILRLPRKMNLMIDPCHTWNAIYNARSDNCHCPNSPNTAPATKNESHDWSLSHMKRYLQCAEQQVSLSKLTKYCACHAKWLSKILQKFLENSWNVISNAGPIREWSEHDPSNIRAGNRPPQPASQQRWLFALATSIFYWKIQHFALRLSFQISPNTAPATKSDSSTSPNTAPATQSDCHDWSSSHMKCHLQCAEQPVSSSNITEYCACHAKWISWLVLVTHETLFTMRGVTTVIAQTHQILRLPRKMNLMIDPCHTWNAIYNARSNKCHCPNSPNTAPATQNDSPKFCKNFSKTAETSFPMRGRSENDPSMIRATSEQETVRRNPPRNRGDFSRSPRSFSIEKYNISRSGYHSKFHRILRLPRKVWQFNITKYCACHAKWISWLVLATHETLFTMRGVTTVIAQTHQILRLPRKMNLMIDPCHTWNAIYNARSNKCHCPNSPNTAPATQNDSPKFCKNFSKTAETSFPMRGRSENDPRMIRAGSELDPSWKPSSATRLATEVTFQDHHEHFVLKNTTFRAPAIIPNFTEYCACHEKWHFNFTEYCACHEKWHLNVTK